MQPSRADTNQPEIVATLRGMGCTVQHLHAVGQGVPDLLVGVRGVNLLVEVKYEDGQLNAVQTAWHDAWRGQAIIVRTSEHAAELVAARARSINKTATAAPVVACVNQLRLQL